MTLFQIIMIVYAILINLLLLLIISYESKNFRWIKHIMCDTKITKEDVYFIRNVALDYLKSKEEEE